MEFQHLTKHTLIRIAGNDLDSKKKIEDLFSKLPNPNTYEYPEYRIYLPPTLVIEVSPNSDPETHLSTLCRNEIVFKKISNHPFPGMTWALK